MLQSQEAKRQIQSDYLAIVKSFLESCPFSTKDGTLYELHEGSIYIFMEIEEEGMAGGYEIDLGRHRITGTFAWEEGYQSLLNLLRFLKLLIDKWS